MGETSVKVRVFDLKGEKYRDVDVLVDTGATYTAIPERILEEIGIERIGKVRIEFANGEIEERDIGNVLIEVEGIRRANPVIFAKEKDASVLGLITLESCGLTVDPVSKKLIPLKKIHFYFQSPLIPLHQGGDCQSPLIPLLQGGNCQSPLIPLHQGGIFFLPLLQKGGRGMFKTRRQKPC